MNTDQIKLVQTLLGTAGLRPYKEDIIASHTNGRTVSLKECTLAETQSVIKYLKGYAGQPEDSDEKMRRKIISKAHEMFWKLPDGRIDMKRLNDWLVKYGQFHKNINALNSVELPATLTQIEKVLETFLKGI